MLFFSANLIELCKVYRWISKIPSPVRSVKECLDLVAPLRLKKRVSLPAPKAFGFCASMSVEAALALPLCLFAGVILMTPMKLLQDQRRIQGALEQAARDLSTYAYVKELVESGKEAGSGGEALISLISIGYVRNQVMKHVRQERIEQVSFAKSRILGEDDEIRLVMNYQQKLPFSVFGLDSVPMEAISVRRAWVGAEGGRLKTLAEGQEDEADPVVYIGKDGTRYHLSSSCHYLSNNLTDLSQAQLESARNAEGKRYQPCAVCGGRTTQGNVYVMPSGSSYHTTQFCSSIAAYVRAVKKSEVEHLGACSYCGGG